jgi:RimJ/RimL family protein N-acetyltransferase
MKGHDMDRMKIRKITGSDMQDLYEVLSDPAVMKYIEPPFSMEQTKQFLKDYGLCEPPKIYAAETDDGKFVGYVIFHEYDPDSMEIGWLIKKKYWHKGYATELTKMLIEKTRKLGKDAMIECASDQEITKKIAIKAGFLNQYLIRMGTNNKEKKSEEMLYHI